MEQKIYNSKIITVIILVSLFLVTGLVNLVYKDLSMKQNEQSIRFGAVYMTLNNPFYTVINEEMRTQIENHGDILITRNPNLDEAKQEEEINELIDLGIKVLFINPIDSHNIASVLEKAVAAGIHIIAIDTNVEKSNLVESTIVSDNYMAGVQCAQHLIKSRSEGKVAILTHDKVTSAKDRIRGFTDVLKQNPSFVIVDQIDCLGQLELAMPAMEEMLERHPDIDVVMALNDPSALGAMAALKNANKLSDTMVYGIDGTDEAREMIENGLMTGSVSQEPKKIARLAVAEAYKILNNKQADKLIKIPVVLVTKGSVSSKWIN